MYLLTLSPTLSMPFDKRIFFSQSTAAHQLCIHLLVCINGCGRVSCRFRISANVTKYYTHRICTDSTFITHEPYLFSGMSQQYDKSNGNKQRFRPTHHQSCTIKPALPAGDRETNMPNIISCSTAILSFCTACSQIRWYSILVSQTSSH